MKGLLLGAICLLTQASAVAQTPAFKPYVGDFGAKIRSQHGAGMLPEFWWDQLMTCSVHVGKIGEFLADKDKLASDQFITGSRYIAAAAFRRAVLDSGMSETMTAQIVVGPYAVLAGNEMDVLMAEAEAKGSLDEFVQGELGRCDGLVGQYIAAFPNDLPQ